MGRIPPALRPLRRFIGTPRVAKHRLFVWLPRGTLPDSQVIVVARDDDFAFGVLHSRPHEVWSLRMDSFLGVGNDPRYTPSTTFETFPFPRPVADARGAVSAASRALAEARDRALAGGDTLTKLYNRRPAWLARLHEDLDRAVHAAYGWPHPLPDEEVLKRLLALNLERAARSHGP